MQPRKLTTDNELITVGAVDGKGTLAQGFTLDSGSGKGSITVYAQGIQVLVASVDARSYERVDGTSVAAPQVVSPFWPLGVRVLC